MTKENRIVGVSGGLYTVETPYSTVQAKSRGVFRLNGIKPVTGDYVKLHFENNAETVITDAFHGWDAGETPGPYNGKRHCHWL